jgi:toxin ParE1/3/4
MKVRWSPESAADFAGIIDYIRRENVSAADRLANTVYDSISSLESFPGRGRAGKIEGTRELVLTPLPYIVVYRVNQDVLEIARILHGSQRWP